MVTAAPGNTTGSTPATAARVFSNGVSEGIGRMSANLETRYLSQAALPSSPLLPPPPLFVPKGSPLRFQAAPERPDLDLSFPLFPDSALGGPFPWVRQDSVGALRGGGVGGGKGRQMSLQ